MEEKNQIKDKLMKKTFIINNKQKEKPIDKLIKNILTQ